MAIEKQLDGVYVIRSSVKREAMTGDDLVRHYKGLGETERTFRTMKVPAVIGIRPVRHYDDDMIASHMFIVTLATYVYRFMREAWRPLTFASTDAELRMKHDPVAPARKSESARRKASTRMTEFGFAALPYVGLVHHLSRATITYCRYSRSAKGGFYLTPTLTACQQQALKLLDSLIGIVG